MNEININIYLSVRKCFTKLRRSDVMTALDICERAYLLSTNQILCELNLIELLTIDCLCLTYLTMGEKYRMHDIL